MLQSYFPANNKVQTKFQPIFISDKTTPKLSNNVHPMSKKLKISFFWTFYVPTKEGEKIIHHECPCRIEKSHPRGWNFNQGLTESLV